MDLVRYISRKFLIKTVDFHYKLIYNENMGKDVAILDIGSCKLIFATGHKNSIGSCEITSFSWVPFAGYYESEFINLDGLLDDVTKVFTQANLRKMPKCLYVGVPAEFSRVETKTSLMNLGREKLISSSIINELHAKGDQYSRYDGWEVFSSSAINYLLDDERNVVNPYGERAKNIKATISYVYVKSEFVELFDVIAKQLGFEEAKYISSPWAVATRFVDEDSRYYGALSLDIGFGSTSLSYVKGDGLVKMASASIGKGSIYGKLSQQLNVSFDEALSIEKSINLDFEALEGALYTIFTESQVKTYRAKDVNNAVSARIKEIADFVNTVINEEPGLISDTVTLYLTGGGIAGIKGGLITLEKYLKRKVRGRAPGITNYDKPYFASMYALLDAACDINDNQSIWKKLF